MVQMDTDTQKGSLALHIELHFTDITVVIKVETAILEPKHPGPACYKCCLSINDWTSDGEVNEGEGVPPPPPCACVGKNRLLESSKSLSKGRFLVLDGSDTILYCQVPDRVSDPKSKSHAIRFMAVKVTVAEFTKQDVTVARRTKVFQSHVRFNPSATKAQQEAQQEARISGKPQQRVL